MDDEVVVLNGLAVRVRDRTNRQSVALRRVGVDVNNIRSKRLVVVIAESAGLLIMRPLEIVIGVSLIDIQRQRLFIAVGNEGQIRLALVCILLLPVIVVVYEFLSNSGLGAVIIEIQNATDSIIGFQRVSRIGVASTSLTTSIRFSSTSSI